MYPEAIEHGIKEEENAKFYYTKVNEKKHCSFDLEEPGLLISSSSSWIGANLDGIRKCQCCDPMVVEIKCPFKGNDLDPKIAFLLPTVGGKKDENENVFLDKNHLYSIIYRDIYCCNYFHDKFWETVVATVYKFYCQ